MHSKVISVVQYGKYFNPVNSAIVQVTDIYDRKSLSTEGSASLTETLGDAGLPNQFVSRFDLQDNRLNLSRSWAHKDSKWKDDAVLKYSFYTGDHKTLTFLASSLMKFAITLPSAVLSFFNVNDAFVFGAFGLSSLVFGSGIYSYYMEDHIKCVKELDSVSRLTRAYIDTGGHLPLNYELVSRISSFSQDTGWNLLFTDSPYLLADADNASETLTLSLGWIVDSPYNSSINRKDYEEYRKAQRQGREYKLSSGARRYGLDQHRFSQLAYILNRVRSAIS